MLGYQSIISTLNLGLNVIKSLLTINYDCVCSCMENCKCSCLRTDTEKPGSTKVPDVKKTT